MTGEKWLQLLSGVSISICGWYAILSREDVYAGLALIGISQLILAKKEEVPHA